MKTTLILVVSIVASVALHLTLITEPAPASPAPQLTVSTRPVQEAVVTGKRLDKFKKKVLVTAAR